MSVNLSQKDKRAIKIGILSVIAMAAFVYLPQWFGHWHDLRSSIYENERILKRAAKQDGPGHAALMSIVPVFKMPLSMQQQKYEFRAKISKMLKKHSIKTDPLLVSVSKKRDSSGYRRLLLTVKGKCKFDKFLDFLVKLKTNPYYVSIESLKMKFDPKKSPQTRRDFDMEIVLSTLFTGKSGK